jgi:hypothetical protein
MKSVTSPRHPKSTKVPKVAQLRQLRDGRIEALSSTGHMVYSVSIGREDTCTCPAGRNGRTCYHVTSAIQRYPALWPLPAKPAPKIDVNVLLYDC